MLITLGWYIRGFFQFVLSSYIGCEGRIFYLGRDEVFDFFNFSQTFPKNGGPAFRLIRKYKVKFDIASFRVSLKMSTISMCEKYGAPGYVHVCGVYVCVLSL